MSTRLWLALSPLLPFVGGYLGGCASPPVPRAAPPGIRETAGLEQSFVDPRVDPCVDFFQFACGGWLRRNPIPEGQTRWSRFKEVQARNETLAREILEEAPAGQGPQRAKDDKVRDFYAACMDEQTVERAGTTGIEALLARSAAVTDLRALAIALGELHRHEVWAGFSLWTAPDFMDPGRQVVFVDSDEAVTLPDRDYYLQTEKPHIAAARQTYQQNLALAFRRGGASAEEVRQAVADVMLLETELARAMMPRQDRAEIRRLWNPVTRAGLAELAPAFPWDSYFASLGHPRLQALSVTTPAYLRRFNELLTSVPASAWRHYVQWRVLWTLAPLLPRRPFAALGRHSRLPRWQYCVDMTDQAMPHYLARRFVERRFAAASRASVASLVSEIEQTFLAELRGLDWMGGETKRHAEAKLRAMGVLIGYPDRWDDYDFPVDRRAFAGNVLRSRAWGSARLLAGVGGPVDRAAWDLSPFVASSGYNRALNRMAFAAGNLQPPFFGPEQSLAVNLAGIGMTIGHELTHGFDRSGALFDEHGRLRNWWRPEDAAAFREKAGCLVEQYSRYQVLPGVRVNGELTLNENIADLGGVKLAYLAYRRLLDRGGEARSADRLGQDRRFFLAFAQSWCSAEDESYTRRVAFTEQHAHPRFRVNGTLANLPEFARAYQCPTGKPMAPAAPCAVW